MVLKFNQVPIVAMVSSKKEGSLGAGNLGRLYIFLVSSRIKSCAKLS